jgi:UDP-N-acetylglucosamine 2-epimerase
MQGPNVINARFDDGAIRRALRSALSAGFRAQLRRSCVNPYGDGRSAQRILDCLRRTPIDSKLLVKGLTY